MDSLIDRESQFEEAYVAHADAIKRYLLWRTSEPLLAEDLTSETFAKAWRSKEKFNGGSYKAWLYRIAQNLLIDHWRKHKEVPMCDSVEHLVSSENLLEDVTRNDDAKSLKLAVGRLPKKLRSVVELRFIEGLSAKETGEVLGLNEGNVRVLQHRALKKLQITLTEHE